MNGGCVGDRADRRRGETSGETEEVEHEVVRADNQLPNAPGSASPSSGSRRRRRRRRRRRPLIVCDCAYGWPTQKRPRSERVRAVARQLRNFLDWRENDFDDERRREDDFDDDDYDNVHSEVVVIGAEEDLRPLRERLDVLASSSSSSSSSLGLVFRSGTSVRECVAEHLSRETGDDDSPTRSEDEEANDASESLTRATERLRVTDDGDDDERGRVVVADGDSGDAVVAYLSPDAPRALDPTSAPPDVVVVGMLVDRRVTPGRSRRRAESAGVDSARLPLGAVFASSASRDDDEREPLNIDTVLEIVERWRWLRRDDNGTKDERAFVEAATRALRRHRERHPNQQELRQKQQEART